MKVFLKGVHALVALGLSAALPAIGMAAVASVGANAFGPSASVIGFDDTADVPLGSQNPTYTFNSGLPNELNDNIGGTFLGQTASDQNSPPVTLTADSPSSPLTLDPNGPSVFTTSDPASATSPVLSSTPLFEAPISILFDHPVSQVGLTGGSFAAANFVTMEAYGANGTVLGSTTNTSSGFQFLGLGDTQGANSIEGISIFINTSQALPSVAGPASGLEIDNVTFSSAVPVPLPSAFSMGLIGLSLCVVAKVVHRHFHRAE